MRLITFPQASTAALSTTSFGGTPSSRMSLSSRSAERGSSALAQAVIAEPKHCWFGLRARRRGAKVIESMGGLHGRWVGRGRWRGVEEGVYCAGQRKGSQVVRLCRLSFKKLNPYFHHWLISRSKHRGGNGKTAVSQHQTRLRLCTDSKQAHPRL